VQPIMANAGKDATSDWNAIHNKDIIEKIAPDQIKVNNVMQSPPQQ